MVTIFDNPCEEFKEARTQLLLRPSTKNAIKKIARAKKTSMNDLINQILEEYINHINNLGR